MNLTNTRKRIRDRAISRWERLSGSLWFVPGLVSGLLIAFAFGLIELSRVLGPMAFDRVPRVFGATPESSRSMLSTIAGSMITVAGVTFSIMVVAVSQASSQYTPRVLRNFMRDRPTQVTLGVLVGVFAYCLVVLKTVRSEGSYTFAPELAVLGALLLALVAVAFLMYFIHHIASTLEAGSILAGIARESCATASRLFPQFTSDASESGPDTDRAALTSATVRWEIVPAHRSGYIQHVDADGLLQWSIKKNCIVRMEVAVGEFAVQGLPLVSLANRQLSPRDGQEINELFVLDTYRTVFQDLGFGIRQMVDIALKALSPGVNDVTTAISAIHHITAVLVEVADRCIPSNFQHEGDRLRVIARSRSFEEFVDEAFDEVRRSGTENPRVLCELAKALHLIGRATHTQARRRALIRHLDLLREATSGSRLAPHDRPPVLAIFADVQCALQKRS